MTKTTLREQVLLKFSNALWQGKSLDHVSKIPKDELERLDGLIDDMVTMLESTSKEARTRGIKDLTVAMEARLANKGLNMPVSRVVTYLEEEKDGLLGSSPDVPALDKQDVRSNDKLN